MPAAHVPVRRVIEKFLRDEIDVGSFASAVYAIGNSRGITAEGAVGNAVSVPLRIPATLDTIYDCASLTKPLVTTALILQKIKNIDDKFHDFTYRELLTHTSGLRAWLPLYAYEAEYIDTILKEGPEYKRGTKVVYSDLNFILLWYALEKKLSVDVPDAYIVAPLDLRPRIAATEWGQRYEAKMANRPAPRDGLIWGETHDGNSFFAGGTAGNAGLFATARAVFRMAQMWVNAEILPRAIVDEATRNHTEGLDDARGLGWQLPTGSEATSMLSPRAFGHTGFTGTSVWVEPDRDRIMVLLTNRVHPCAAPINIQRIRGEFHRIALSLGRGRPARSAAG